MENIIDEYVVVYSNKRKRFERWWKSRIYELNRHRLRVNWISFKPVNTHLLALENNDQEFLESFKIDLGENI